jgi:hypothetical protein
MIVESATVHELDGSVTEIRIKGARKPPTPININENSKYVLKNETFENIQGTDDPVELKATSPVSAMTNDEVTDVGEHLQPNSEPHFLKCYFCSMNFDSPQYRDAHSLCVHSTYSPPGVLCSGCSLQFDTLTHFHDHLKVQQ